MNTDIAMYSSRVLTRSLDPTRKTCEPQEGIAVESVHTEVFLGALSPYISSDSDEELLLKISKGSKEALSCLYDRLAPSIYNVAARILRDEAEAEDLVHEVFLFIYNKASQFDPEKGSARTWIIHAVYNRALNRRNFLNVRHHYQSDELNEENVRDVRSIDNEQASVDQITARQLQASFQEFLTPDQRETLEMHFFGGYTFREIAERTGRSLETVRKQYYRGCERLRAHVLGRREATK